MTEYGLFIGINPVFCPTVDSTEDINELKLDLSLVLGFTAHILKCTYLVILTYHSELTLTYYDWDYVNHEVLFDSHGTQTFIAISQNSHIHLYM